MSNGCVLCRLVPVFVAGVVGHLAGSMALIIGFSVTLASVFAGLVGLLAAEAILFACTLITSRYCRIFGGNPRGAQRQ